MAIQWTWTELGGSSMSIHKPILNIIDNSMPIFGFVTNKQKIKIKSIRCISFYVPFIFNLFFFFFLILLYLIFQANGIGNVIGILFFIAVAIFMFCSELTNFHFWWIRKIAFIRELGYFFCGFFFLYSNSIASERYSFAVASNEWDIFTIIICVHWQYSHNWFVW